jgi:hypothetical protein
MNIDALVGVVKKSPIGFGCGLLSLALIGAIYFRSEDIPSAEAELAEKSSQFEKIAMNIKYSAQLKEQVDALTAANRQIDGRVIRASQLGVNTQYFYQVESVTGVKIIDLRQTTAATVPAPAKGTFVPVSFAVTVQGNLTQILEFLREIENGAHYSRILTVFCTGNAAARSTPLTLTLALDLLGIP